MTTPQSAQPPGEQKPATSAPQAPSTTTVEALKASLAHCLQNITSDGSFCFSGVMDKAPNPGLFIERAGGSIGLPLAERDAKAIREGWGKRAVTVKDESGQEVTNSQENEMVAGPTVKQEYGLELEDFDSAQQMVVDEGDQMVVDEELTPKTSINQSDDIGIDTSDSKTCELTPKDFELRNPAWEAYIKTSAIVGIAHKMGAQEGVIAELHSLVLQEEGATLKAHEEFQLESHVFGTFIIVLPSKHGGGDLQFSYAGKTQTLATAPNSDYELTYLAWFSNVTHEAGPVVSGRRFMLVYKLCHTGPRDYALSASSNKSLVDLTTSLQKWESMDAQTAPAYFSLITQHRYADVGLCFNELEGQDIKVAYHLREACRRTTYTLYLASVEEIAGVRDVKSNDTDSTVERTTLSRIATFDGKHVTRSVQVDDKSRIPLGTFLNKKADKVGREDVNGNAKHGTVILLISKLKRLELFLGAKSSPSGYRPSVRFQHSANAQIDNFLQHLSRKIANDPPHPRISAELAVVCRLGIGLMMQWSKATPVTLDHAPLAYDCWRMLISSILTLGDTELLSSALAACCSPSMYQDVGFALAHSTISEKPLSKLSLHLQSLSSGPRRITICNNVKSGIDLEAVSPPENADALYLWLDSALKRAVQSGDFTTPEAGRVLAKLTAKESLEVVKEWLLPVVVKHAKYTPMLLAYLSELLRPDSRMPQNDAHAVFEKVLPTMLEQFDLESLCAAEIVADEVVLKADEPNSNNAIVVLQKCCSLPDLFLFERYISTLIADVSVGVPRLLTLIYLPIARATAQHLQGFPISSTRDFWLCYLIKEILYVLVTRFVREQPKPPSNWIVPELICSCAECAVVNTCLRAPGQSYKITQMSNKKIGHVEYKLRGISGAFKVVLDSQTLIITKTHNEHEMALQAWRLRRDYALSAFRAMDEALLRRALGGFYQDVMNMDIPKLVGQAAKNTGMLEPPASENKTAPSAAMSAIDAESVAEPSPDTRRRKLPSGEVIEETDVAK